MRAYTAIVRAAIVRREVERRAAPCAAPTGLAPTPGSDKRDERDEAPTHAGDGDGVCRAEAEAPLFVRMMSTDPLLLLALQRAVRLGARFNKRGGRFVPLPLASRAGAREGEAALRGHLLAPLRTGAAPTHERASIGDERGARDARGAAAQLDRAPLLRRRFAMGVTVL